MNPTEIYELIDRFERSGLTGLELKRGDTHLKLERAPVGAGAATATVNTPLQSATAPAARNAEAAAPAHGYGGRGAGEQVIKSPIVGIYYNAPAPGKELFAAPGSRVKKGDVVCVIEAMKTFNNVTAPFDCVIKEILVENEALVEFGTPLLAVEEL